MAAALWRGMTWKLELSGILLRSVEIIAIIQKLHFDIIFAN
jgi:hypothetical protein